MTTRAIIFTSAIFTAIAVMIAAKAYSFEKEYTERLNGFGQLELSFYVDGILVNRRVIDNGGFDLNRGYAKDWVDNWSESKESLDSDNVKR